ncbi:MAG: putative addiction module antidote protein [Lactobacillales bacterium]|nr:putative addiction module antidote protein [Lactobacillales bacterium]
MANYITSDEMIEMYLAEVLKENNPQMFIKAIGDMARAKGMAKVARETGLSRENLYKQFSATGNPSFATVLKVLSALGMEILPYKKTA